MTELYIDKQLVVLPETFSITIIEENPFFTKNGKYTYDITLSLLDPVNARIYKHLNRINRKGDIPKNRSAYLVVDNEVVLNGTEVILEHTESEVKIQLVSGNSELNFLIGGDKKLRDLNLGKANPYKTDNWKETARLVYDDLSKVYPERNWVLAPYTAGYDTDLYAYPSSKSILRIGNQFTLPNHTQMPGLQETSEAYPQYEAAFSGQIPQPYLCFIIRQILKDIGYTLKYNAIEEDAVRKQMYIVHGYRTLQFAKMLPDWTVTEFFEQLELWLDATTIVNPYDKSVNIMFNYQSAVSAEKQSLNILDEYTVEYEEDNNVKVQTSNVAYDLDDDDYYKYSDIGAFIRKNAKHQPYISSPSDLMSQIENSSDDSIYGNIYDVTYRGENSFIAFNNNNKKTLKKVDFFKPLLNNSDNKEDIDISLKIIPASFVSVYIETASDSVTEITSDFWLQIAVAEDYDDLLPRHGENTYPEEDPDVISIENIQDAIDSGENGEMEKGGTKLRLAIYNGAYRLSRKRLGQSGGNTIIHTASYPMPFVESLYEDYPDSKEERYAIINHRRYNPFRLDEMNRDIYSRMEDIVDTRKLYKFSFINEQTKDITGLFIASNKKYQCLKIERTITSLGFNKVAKGEFYSHLSDEE